jgi:hypothetical protein
MIKSWWSSLRFCIVLGFLFSTLQSCNFSSRGASTREDLLSIYLRSLESKDEQEILKLIPEDYDSEQVVKEKIARLGNRKLAQLKITYQELNKPDSAKILIEGDYYDKPLPNGKRMRSTDQIFIHTLGNRWYLILGQQKKPS